MYQSEMQQKRSILGQANDCQMPADVTREIPLALDELSEVCHNLLDALGELSKRLEPVCVPPSPETGAQSAGVRLLACPAANSIRSNTNRIHDAVSTVRDLLSRVQA